MKAFNNGAQRVLPSSGIWCAVNIESLNMIVGPIGIKSVDDKVDWNRFYSEVSFNLSKNIDANIFYLWQSSRSSSEWKDINLIGTSLKFLF